MSNFSQMFVEEELARVEKPEKREPLGLLFWLCVGWIGLNIIGAILANFLPLIDPLYQNYNTLNAGPSLHHLFGTKLGHVRTGRLEVWSLGR